VTGSKVITEIVSLKFGQYYPSRNSKGNVFRAEGKQFPLMTSDVGRYLFCYAS